MSDTQQAGSPDRLSHRDFQRLASFIENYSGIKMPPTKITMVEGRLRRRLRPTGLPNLKQYCEWLFQKNGLATEAIHLIDVVTTNKTEFFREPDHFSFLTDKAVPRLMSNAPGGPRKPLKIWSAACSIGAEPYTLAMVLSDPGLQDAGLRFDITATDLSTEVLGTAVAGIYPEAMMQPVSTDMQRRFVLRSKIRTRHLVRIVPELRATIRFGRINLMEPSYQADRDMDVIFCRNILIYFDKETQHTVLQRLCEHLRPGGYLFLGHSESIAGLKLPVEPAAPTVFRRL